MSVSVGRVRRIRARKAAALKSRRQRRYAIAGGVLLVALLAIQVPRTLDMLNPPSGSSTAESAAPAPPKPAAPRPSRQAARELRALLAAAATDPFSERAIVDREPQPVDVASPPGLRDPFRRGDGSETSRTQAVPQPLPHTIVVGTPQPGRAPTIGYIVLLASIPTTDGQASANDFAVRARAGGVTNVSVLDSSSRKPLRPGYYVVYVGPFSTPSQAMTEQAHMRSRGYTDAYIRQLIQY